MRKNRMVPVLCLLAVTLLAPASLVHADPDWTKASTAKIHPGVQTISLSGQCTANFVFYDGKNVFIGQAAHCTSKGGPSDVDGCRTPVHPLGVPVRIEGALHAGVVVYNSWATMQRVREHSRERCLGNDFALIRIARADHARVNPSIPFWGGPRGMGKTPAAGDTVYSYGDSQLRLGAEELSPKAGIATRRTNGGWTHRVYTLTPGIPGDSGSAVLDSKGRALAVLSTVALLPPLENGATDLTRALTYMKWKTSLDKIELATGTLPFPGPLKALSR